MQTHRPILGLVPVFVLLLALSACGSDGDSNPTGPTSSAAVDVSGTWSVIETVTSAQCDEFGSYGYTVVITQNGSAITVSTPDGAFQGAVSERTVRWSGSYPDDGGTVVIDQMSVEIAPDGQSFTGGATWTWHDGSSSFTCSGSTNVSGTRGIR